jgi:hypothetical protein
MNNTPITPLHTTSDAECKCCGARALNVMRDHKTAPGDQDREQKTFMCALCGDGWVSTIHKDRDSAFGRWLHNPSTQPKLVRTIELQHSPDLVIPSHEDGEWVYWLGGEEVEQEEWFATLESRRQNMKDRLAN